VEITGDLAGKQANVTRPAETGTLQSGKTIIGWFQAKPGPANRQDNCSIHRPANAGIQQL
jgi:hypothetical protein